jgi:aerobic carbon-monoxide dehydrogenase medium subunit
VIPAEFDYAAPESLEAAFAALASDEDAKLLAGGHSLIPLMKLRLAAPTLLVDLRRIPGLTGISRENGTFRLGAMTRHHDVAVGELGLASLAARTIADQQVRNSGTVGGTLVHGDPASDMPAILLAAEGSVVVAKAGGGTREIAAGDLFQEFLTTAVEPDEIVTEVRFPALEGYGYGYHKFNRRQEDWAMVAVSALLKVSDGTVEDVRIGLTNMGSTPLRASAAEDALRGQPLSEQTIAAAAELAAEGTEPPGDLNASAEYKRHLARVLTRRALADASQ